MVQVIGLVLRPGGGPEALATLRQLQQAFPHLRYLVERDGRHALTHPAPDITSVDAATFAREAQLVVVLGGDGTFIHAASLLRERLVPILGINLGHLGFLTEVCREEMLEAVALALAGRLPHSDRMRLDAALYRQGAVVLQRRVLNDVVLSLEALARIATYRIEWHDELVTTVRGDGVIVATPTGSTAYALAAGGSILSPQLEAVVCLPVCPHQLTQRPLVLQPEGEFKISLVSDSPVFATLDGQEGSTFRPGDLLVIKRAPVPTRVLSVPWRSYFETLRTKLQWGGEA